MTSVGMTRMEYFREKKLFSVEFSLQVTINPSYLYQSYVSSKFPGGYLKVFRIVVNPFTFFEIYYTEKYIEAKLLRIALENVLQKAYIFLLVIGYFVQPPFLLFLQLPFFQPSVFVMRVPTEKDSYIRSTVSISVRLKFLKLPMTIQFSCDEASEW